jgi:hypothetical protein
LIVCNNPDKFVMYIIRKLSDLISKNYRNFGWLFQYDKLKIDHVMKAIHFSCALEQ